MIEPFNLKKALLGDKVGTRDGRPVEDVYFFPTLASEYRVFADVDGTMVNYTVNGEYSEGSIHDLDLMMYPEEIVSNPSLNENIKKQIDLLTEERIRAKAFLNKNGFDCTTAPWLIIKQYRDAIKSHIEILRLNLDDE